MFPSSAQGCALPLLACDEDHSALQELLLCCNCAPPSPVVRSLRAADWRPSFYRHGMITKFGGLFLSSAGPSFNLALTNSTNRPVINSAIASASQLSGGQLLPGRSLGTGLPFPLGLLLFNLRSPPPLAASPGLLGLGAKNKRPLLSGLWSFEETRSGPRTAPQKYQIRLRSDLH